MSNDNDSLDSDDSLDSRFDSLNLNETLWDIPELDIKTEDEMLVEGLALYHYTQEEVFKVQRETSNYRFRSLYGANPDVVARLWEMLQTTTIPCARLQKTARSLKYFFMTLHFLKRYPTEVETEAAFHVSDFTVRHYKWLYVQKIRELKADVLGWPTKKYRHDTWVISIDGTHVKSYEPTHPVKPKDTEAFSHKHQSAGYNIEIGLSLWESKLLWWNGPFSAGKHCDVKIFTEFGLKDKLTETGQKAIADGGYSGHPDLVSTPNSHDYPEVAEFKRRVRQRHERYNGVLKEFDCLMNIWRHSAERLSQCFEAVAVITELKMQMGEPLFDV